MNIKEAKDEIKRSVEIYLDKNEYGEYTIPVSKQRPIFMVGAPGIGKTAIMQQIASELNIALVSYSMTHHTRQSALGLPVIEEREYGGRTAIVSEYTVSEIIAAIYNVMRESGKKEGILFLDEINCVSETLAPAMLLFLQYKIFGNRQIPQGWVVVTAGNPPEYNKSVKEFDVATLDRLKRIDVTEDFTVWKQYAYQQGIHASIIAFLEINQQWFYSIRSTVEGMQYVTARGWEDLSTAVQLYEKKGFAVDRRLIGQYITDAEIARKYGIYYDLYQKYKSDYQIADILAGQISEAMIARAQTAKIDERFSILGLLLEKLNEGFRLAVRDENSLQMAARALRIIKKAAKGDKAPIAVLLQEHTDELLRELEERKAANNVTEREREEYLAAIQSLTGYMSEAETGYMAGRSRRQTRPSEYMSEAETGCIAGRSRRQTGHLDYMSEDDTGCIAGVGTGERDIEEVHTRKTVLKTVSPAEAGTGDRTTEKTREGDAKKEFEKVKKKFGKDVRRHEKQVEEVRSMLEAAFRFIETVWGDNQEMVLFMTELTAGADSLFFINQWGCESYFKYNQELLTYDQNHRLMMEVQGLLEEL